jgi:hypothetical protein
MTANKYNIGDAVKWKGKPVKHIIHYIYSDKAMIAYQNSNIHFSVELIDLEPWSDWLHCPFCGAEILIIPDIDEDYKESDFYDNAIHAKNCPLKDNHTFYDTEQEAIDAYSMKWEG